VSAILQAPPKPSASRTLALHEIARHHSGNGKLIKGKLHSEAAAGLYPAFSASGQDVWHTEYGYEGNAIIVSAVGARCGKCFVAQGRWSAIANTHVVWPDPERIELKYLWYLLNDEQFWIRSGSAQPFVSTKKTFEKEIPLPSLDEQREIVAEIEKQFTRLEAGVGALKRVQANLRRYRAAVLKAACEGKLVPTEAELARAEGRSYESGEQLLQRILSERRENWTGRGKYKEPAAPDTSNLPELPEGWVWASPYQLSASDSYSLAIGPFGSNLKVSDYTDSGVPLIFVRNIRPGRFAKAKEVFVTVEKASKLNAHCVSGGDILITKMGAPPGDACIYPDVEPIAVITADCIKFRASKLLKEKSYIVCALNSLLVKPQIANITKGVAQMKVSLGRFESIAIPLPPLAEQKRIVEEVERRLSVIDEMEATVSANLQRATRLRQSILQKAFTGELIK
jgi:type I restriction enzyme S subunit